jgi:hypothetical protein
MYIAFFILFVEQIHQIDVISSNISFELMRPAGVSFSNLSTPRGHTAAQIPQPTQGKRTMFSPFEHNYVHQFPFRNR